MDSLTFTLMYIALAYTGIGIVWVVTTPLSALISARIVSWNTRVLQIGINVLHFVSAIFFPLPLPFDVPIRSFGLTILTVGMVLAIWAKITMKENWGMPGIHAIARQKQLVKIGPFAYTRNPIYVGIVLMSFGMAIALKSPFVFLVFVLFSYFYHTILKEENALAQHFGEEYIHYCSDVPRFI